ncbi:MAG: hypothetical protein ACK5KP_02070 [Paludibacteraceae bacterium]
MAQPQVKTYQYDLFSQPFQDVIRPFSDSETGGHSKVRSIRHTDFSIDSTKVVISFRESLTPNLFFTFRI